MLNALYRTAERLGVQVAYEAEVIDLEIKDRTFRTASVRRNGATSSFPTKAFVAASGGFEANLDWLKESWGSVADNFLIRGTPYNTGELLRVLLARGVEAVSDPKQCHAVAIDARAEV